MITKFLKMAILSHLTAILLLRGSNLVLWHFKFLPLVFTASAGVLYLEVKKSPPVFVYGWGFEISGYYFKRPRSFLSQAYSERWETDARTYRLCRSLRDPFCQQWQERPYA